MQMNAGCLCEVEFQGVCHEPDDRQMAAKCLHQSLWGGIPASISHFEIQLMGPDYFGKTLLFWLISLFGLNGGVEGRRGTVVTREKVSVSKNSPQKVSLLSKKCFP